MKLFTNIAVTAALFLGVAGMSPAATLIPTEQLPQYFNNNNIEFRTVPNFYGTGGELDYLFVPTRNLQEGETIGVFFELYTGISLNDDDVHWAVGLRGPRPGGPADHYAGRGLALGKLGFDHCSGPGGFIEDFTAAKQGGELQLTYCEPEPLQNRATYRIDVHVSKLNVFVAVWEKRNTWWLGDYYVPIAEYSCTHHDGPGRTGYCPQDPVDEPYGGVFIGSAFLDPGYGWTASNIHIAFF